MRTYFAMDGNYGDAEEFLVVDTSMWDDDDWAAIEFATSSERLAIARQIDDGEYNPSQLELPLES